MSISMLSFLTNISERIRYFLSKTSNSSRGEEALLMSTFHYHNLTDPFDVYK